MNKPNQAKIELSRLNKRNSAGRALVMVHGGASPPFHKIRYLWGTNDILSPYVV